MKNWKIEIDIQQLFGGTKHFKKLVVNSSFNIHREPGISVVSHLIGWMESLINCMETFHWKAWSIGWKYNRLDGKFDKLDGNFNKHSQSYLCASDICSARRVRVRQLCQKSSAITTTIIMIIMIMIITILHHHHHHYHHPTICSIIINILNIFIMITINSTFLQANVINWSWYHHDNHYCFIILLFGRGCSCSCRPLLLLFATCGALCPITRNMRRCNRHCECFPSMPTPTLPSTLTMISATEIQKITKVVQWQQLYSHISQENGIH